MKNITQVILLCSSLLISNNIIAEESNIDISPENIQVKNELEGNKITEIFEQNITRDMKLGLFEKPEKLSRENVYQMKNEYIKVPNVDRVLFHTTLNSYKAFKITVQFKDMNIKEQRELIKSLNSSLNEKYNNANNYRKTINGNIEFSLSNGKITVLTTDKIMHSSSGKEEGVIYNVSIIYDIENKYTDAFKKYL